MKKFKFLVLALVLAVSASALTACDAVGFEDFDDALELFAPLLEESEIDFAGNEDDDSEALTAWDLVMMADAARAEFDSLLIQQMYFIEMNMLGMPITVETYSITATIMYTILCEECEEAEEPAEDCEDCTVGMKSATESFFSTSMFGMILEEAFGASYLRDGWMYVITGDEAFRYEVDMIAVLEELEDLNDAMLAGMAGMELVDFYIEFVQVILDSEDDEDEDEEPVVVEVPAGVVFVFEMPIELMEDGMDALAGTEFADLLGLDEMTEAGVEMGFESIAMSFLIDLDGNLARMVLYMEGYMIMEEAGPTPIDLVMVLVSEYLMFGGVEFEFPEELDTVETIVLE